MTRRLVPITVLGLALALCTTGAAAMQMLPGDASIGLSAGDQQAPAIARGGDRFLAVWSDGRAAIGEAGTGRDIYAMRLDANGIPIDPVPFIVTQAPADQTNPQVAWNGQNFLVVWEDYGVSGTGSYYSRHVRGARVSPSGIVLDADPISIFRFGSSSSAMFALASDGTNWAVALQGTSSGENAVVGVRVSPEGVVLDVPAVPILAAEYYLRFDLRLAGANGAYLLSWEDLNDLQAVRLGPDLRPLENAPFTLVAGNDGSAQLAANGAGYFAVWTAQQPDFTVAVIGARLGTDGTILDPLGINISRTHSPGANTFPPQVVWNGANWLVTWGYGGLSVARVTPAGTVLDPGGVAVPVPKAGPTAPAPNGGLQMVWDDYTTAEYDAFTAAVAPAFTLGATASLSVGAPAQIQSAVATNGAGWMMVFTGYVSGQLRIMAAPLDAAGNPRTAEPIVLDSGAPQDGPGSPALAWNGAAYLVVWGNASRGGILAQRLGVDGTLLDPTPFLVMRGGSPAVGALGEVFLVVGTQRHPVLEHEVYPVARRVGPDGALLDGQEFTLGWSFARWPAVAELGERWLVVWQRNLTHDNPQAQLYGAFVGPDGVPEGQFFIDGLLTTSMYRGPEVASKGDRALLVWEDERTSSVETDIVGRFIQPDGVLLPSFTISQAPGNQFRTGVAWDGSQFVIAYQDQRNRGSALDILDSRTDLFVSRVSETGAVIDPDGFVFAASAGTEIYPAVAAANGVTLIAGSLLVPEAPFAALRVAYELVDARALPVAVASADPRGGDTPLRVQFSSAGSGDPDGLIASYVWDFGDGATTTGSDPSHTYTTPGNHVARLTVLDDQGLASSVTLLLKVTAPNQPPVAVATADPASGPAPLSVVFSASGSYDPDGAIGNMHWAFSDGGEYWGSPAYHTFYAEGTHTATLTVFDDRGGTGTTTLIITVGTANQPPTAVASAAPTSGVAPLVVSFSAAGSSDPDGTISSYGWTFGDGATSTLPNPSHTYAAAAPYTATLTVTDDAGATDVATVTVTVAPPSDPLVRSAAIDLSAKSRRDVVTVTGEVLVVDGDAVPVRNAVVSAVWTRPDGSSEIASASSNLVGIAKLTTSGGHGAYTLTVTNITKAGYVFDPANSVLTGSVVR